MSTSANNPPESPGPPISSPWVLLDEDTVDQAATVLERLTSWLLGGPDPTEVARSAHAHCAQALSVGETTDPISIASWTDAIAARLRRRAEESQL